MLKSLGRTRYVKFNWFSETTFNTTSFNCFYWQYQSYREHLCSQNICLCWSWHTYWIFLRTWCQDQYFPLSISITCREKWVNTCPSICERYRCWYKQQRKCIDFIFLMKRAAIKNRGRPCHGYLQDTVTLTFACLHSKPPYLSTSGMFH